MTVADNTSRNQYTATSGQTVFAYTFEIIDKSHIVVLQNGVTLSEGTDYTVSGVGNDSGGNVTLTSGATTSDILTLYRDMPHSRTQNYTNSGDFLASEVNADFDNLWLAGEQTDRSFSQSIRKPITDSDSISMELPAASTRANQYLKFTDTGAVTTVSTYGLDSINVRDYGATGNGSTDDTTAIQNAINAAASQGKTVYIPEGHYIVTTLYDHYDATNNPGFPLPGSDPAGLNNQQGRVYLRGEKPVPIEQIFSVELYGNSPSTMYKGTILETLGAGPLFKMGKGLPATDSDATRGTVVKNLSMKGESVTDTLLHIESPQSEAELENLVLRVKPDDPSRGNVIRLDRTTTNSTSSSYFNRYHNLRISGGSVAVQIDGSEADIWEQCDISGALEKGLVVSGVTNSTFSHCQVTGAVDGMELGLSQNTRIVNCWFENQSGDYDLKVHKRANNVTIDSCFFVSDDLDEAHIVLGDNTGTAADDKCDNVRIVNTSFSGMLFPAVGGYRGGAVLKYKGCLRLSMDNCSFRYRNVSGDFPYGVIVDTQGSVATPTTLTNTNWFPDVTSSPVDFPDANKVVGYNGTAIYEGSYLVRGSGQTSTITSALDMTNWTQLLETIDVDTSGGSITVTMPTFANVEEYKGQIFAIRKTSGSNTLTLSGDFESGSSVALTTAKTYVFVVGPNKFIDITT